MSRLNLVLLSLLFHVLTNAQSPEFYESKPKDFCLFIPKDWNSQNSLAGNTLFSYTPPSTSKDAFMPTTLKLEKGTLKEGFQNADIKEIAKQESVITKAELGNNITVSTDSLRFINNKLWWCFAFTTKGSKKLKSSFYILKTVHNQVTYTLAFSGPEESFDLNFDAAIKSMHSFIFYSKDKTIYSNSISLDKSKLASLLSFYEGQYKQESQDYSHTLLIENSGNPNSYGKEVREFVKNGKKIRFEADLLIEEINNNQIILSTDAVSVYDPSLRWTKAIFTLSKTGEGLSGSMGSKSNAFEPYAINLLKAPGTQPKYK
ncbi:MAG: hypothetical protein JNL23_05430, partial [Chitinophagaceae bacterium]|nr:hypothetical protein [Chitinophagaceae bacterium]